MRINKYPFLLWLTQEREDLELDFKNKRIESEELGSSTIKEMPLYLVLLMKYLPILLILPLLYYPTSKNDILPFLGALITVGIGFFIYFRSLAFLKIYVIGICITNALFMFLIKDYAVFLDIGLTFFAEILLFSILTLDILYFKGFKNWYYLEGFKNEIDIKFSQKKERKILFFLKPKTGFNVTKKFYLKGYFLRIQDENIL